MSREVPQKVADCTNLREYRDYVQGKTQAEIAESVGCTSAWISQIELGTLPKKRHWGPLLKAYKLTQKDFIRLVQGGVSSRKKNENPGPVQDPQRVPEASTEAATS
jgi:DNA-binding XRE family transcriptional regulator